LRSGGPWPLLFTMRFYETVHGVYFDDLDAFKILHNARYIVLFERTIGGFWRHIGWQGAMNLDENPDQSHLVRANHVEYLRPVEDVGQVRVRCWVERLGNTSLTFGLRLLPMDQDVDYARGTRVVVKVDPKTRRPEPWSETLREKLQPYRLDVERAPGA
jgi:acyl-CoA thioester hydrolase